MFTLMEHETINYSLHSITEL